MPKPKPIVRWMKLAPAASNIMNRMFSIAYKYKSIVTKREDIKSICYLCAPMSRTYTISPDPFLVVIKDEEGNSYSCNHLDMIELDGYSVYVPGVYDWYLYFNTYAEWTKHCMDKRFKAKMFHRRGKALAKNIRAQMNPDDVLFYYRSVDDDSGVVQKRSRVRAADFQESSVDNHSSHSHSTRLLSRGMPDYFRGSGCLCGSLKS